MGPKVEAARRFARHTGKRATISMAVLYVVLIFTVAVLSFRKGHWIPCLLGFIFPVLWLIGAVLPRRRHR